MPAPRESRPRRRLRRLRSGVRVFRSPSHFANGNAVDAQGRLVTCEHGTRRLTRTDRDGRVLSLVGRYGTARLNSPNDVVIRSDGTMWFTDPDYGILSNEEGYKAESELGGCFVFCFEPSRGKLRIVAEEMDKPNGLAFSTDESVLYAADSGITHDPGGPHHILAYDVRGNDLEGRRVFARISPGWPDGLCVDDQDNVWTSAGDGVHCISADGTPLGRIRISETVSNCTFGGSDGNRLIITASSSLYAVALRRRGANCLDPVVEPVEPRRHRLADG